MQKGVADKGKIHLVVTWDKSDLREWLNSDFYDRAFTDDERNRIQTSVISTPAHDGWEDSCPDTEDNVFILSASEIWYYKDETVFSNYTLQIGKNLGGLDGDLITYDGFYWLRSNTDPSPKYNEKQPCVSAYSLHFGGVNSGDSFSLNDCIGVRPAIWVSID